MLSTSIAALVLAGFAGVASQADDEGVAKGALALRQLVGSRVVVDSKSVDSKTDANVEALGTVEDLVLDIETGLVTRVLVRDTPPAAKPDAQNGTPEPLRSVPLDSLTVADSGGRAVVTFAYSAEDYRGLPVFDREKDLRPEEGQPTRLFTASDVGRMTVHSSDAIEIGAIRDLWIDLAKKRVDFIEHAIEKGHAAAPWTVMVWDRTDGKLTAAKIGRDAKLVRGIPRVDVDKKHTLKHREYRELVYAAYGVKKEPDTAALVLR